MARMTPERENPSAKKVVGTTTEENLIRKMEEFAKKMETAEILLCDEHQLEFADFETCPACDRERREADKEESDDV
jgi:hypothetical protein